MITEVGRRALGEHVYEEYVERWTGGWSVPAGGTQWLAPSASGTVGARRAHPPGSKQARVS